jgi:tRNA(Ile)-lysidine synthase
VALLRLLLELRSELGIVLSVVHFNHRLRGAESDADEQFVGDLARAHGLEFHSASDDVAQHAADERISLEAAARELRYGFFQHLLSAGKLTSGAEAPAKVESRDRSAESAAPPNGAPGKSDSHLHSAQLNIITTGHTLDDQAETVLMRMIRGAGLKGLGGIHPRIEVEDDDGEICGAILRPLLGVRHTELEQYLRDIGQPWREDSSNADDAFTRNRLRKLVIPLLEKEFNPSVAENLAELSDIARGEEDYWDNEVAGWMGTGVHWSTPRWTGDASGSISFVQIRLADGKSECLPMNLGLRARINEAPWLVMDASVDRVWFLGEPPAVQRRIVKAIGDQAGISLSFRHVEEVLRFAAEAGPSGKELALPLGWKVVREPEALLFVTPDLREHTAPRDYEYSSPVPGLITIRETGTTIEARIVPAGTDAGYNPQQLLDASSVAGPLCVRNWRPGDRFWPNHTKSPRKIKELLQELHVAQPERSQWPVVVSGDEIVWVRGFAVPAKFRAKPQRDALVIVETPFAGDTTR